MTVEQMQRIRSQWTRDALLPYEGKWVAVTEQRDGIIAAADDLTTLRQAVDDAGLDPESVWYERIVLDDDFQGAVELE